MRFRIIFAAFTLPKSPAVQVRAARWLDATDREAAKTEVLRIYTENRAALDAVGWQLEAVNQDELAPKDSPSFEEWATRPGGTRNG
jgi:hypothetical protein